MKKKTKRLSVVAVGVAVIVAAGVMASAASQKEAPEEIQKQIVVETVSPKTGDIAVTGEYVGTVEPGRKVTVYPKASGEVLEVNYNVGDAVEAGDVLFQIDSKTLQASIDQSQAAIASAQAKANYNLAVAQKNLATQEYNVEYGHDNTIKSAEAAVENAEAALKTAENRVDTAVASHSSARRQLRELREDNIYPPSMAAFQDAGYYDQVEAQLKDAVKQAQLAVEAAELGVEQAKQNLANAKSGLKTANVMTEEQNISAQDQVEMAKLSANLNDQYIAIRKLQDDLDNYSVKSPISGVVEQCSIDPYDMVSPQVPSFVISDKNAMTVSFQVSETTWESMKPGDSVTVEKQGSTWPGTITEVSTMASTGGGLYTVKANVENAPFTMNTGSTVKVFAKMQEAKRATTLPINAVYYDNGAAYAFIYDNGVCKKAVLETGVADTENIEIKSGLSPDAQVITTWYSALKDGAEVSLYTQAPQEASGISDGTGGGDDNADTSSSSDVTEEIK